MSFTGLGGLCHSHVLEKVVYQVLRITVSSVLMAIILSGACLGGHCFSL